VGLDEAAAAERLLDAVLRMDPSDGDAADLLAQVPETQGNGTADKVES